MALGGHYRLSNTFYADPQFFNWDTQRGLSQFRAQPLTNVAFPASKGVLFQTRMYHYPQYGIVLSCCMFDLPAPIAFGDLSASEHIMRRMPHGITNFFSRTALAPGVDPRELPGVPVDHTIAGILGRDR